MTFVSTQRKGRGFESCSKPVFFQVILPVVLWLHSHLSLFHYLLLLDTITMKFIFLSRILRPLNMKGRTRSHVASIAQLVEHCTGKRRGRGFESCSKPEFYQVIFSSSVKATFASFILSLPSLFQGESLCIFTVFVSSDSGLNLLNGLIFILIHFEGREQCINKLQRCQTLRGDMQVTEEIMQTYDL